MIDASLLLAAAQARAGNTNSVMETAAFYDGSRFTEPDDMFYVDISASPYTATITSNHYTIHFD